MKVSDYIFTATIECKFNFCHFFIRGLSNLNSIIHALEASLVAQMVKRLPTMRETWVQSLGLEDPLEKGMAAHSCILAWKIPWSEDPGRL